MDTRSDKTRHGRRATIKDVAEQAKVSLKTVSRVINNEPSVMQGTRARVLHAIAELDYEPDPSARNLRSATPFVSGSLRATGPEQFSGTVWQCKAAMRISVSSWRTSDEDVDRSAGAILEAAAAVSGSLRAS